jgi:hypothetical protein
MSKNKKIFEKQKIFYSGKLNKKTGGLPSHSTGCIIAIYY